MSIPQRPGVEKGALGPLSVAAACFEADLAGISEAPDAVRWAFQPMKGELAVWVTMSPGSAPKERFHALLGWTTYPDAAPSVKFGDPGSGRVDRLTDWPTGGPMRPEGGCLCVSYTAEGFGLHPDWRTDPLRRWVSHGNVLLKVVRWLQDDLDTTYAGRHP